MTGLTAITMAANARHSIGKRRIDQKKVDVHASNARAMYRTNQSGPPAFSQLETTAPATMIRAIALRICGVQTRSEPQPDRLAAAKKEPQHKLTGRCKWLRSEGSWLAFGDGLTRVVAASPQLNRPRTVRCAAGI